MILMLILIGIVIWWMISPDKPSKDEAKRHNIHGLVYKIEPDHLGEAELWFYDYTRKKWITLVYGFLSQLEYFHTGHTKHGKPRIGNRSFKWSELNEKFIDSFKTIDQIHYINAPVYKDHKEQYADWKALKKSYKPIKS